MWRAVRGHSVVFAGVFALTLIGLAVVRWVQWGLGWIGLPWWALLILPGLALAWAARREPEWIPDQAVRTKWARGLVLGAVVAALLAAWLVPGVPQPPRERTESVRPRGPAGR